MTRAAHSLTALGLTLGLTLGLAVLLMVPAGYAAAAGDESGGVSDAVSSELPMPGAPVDARGRERFVQAREALARGDEAGFRRLRARLQGYTLEYYLDYEALKRRFARERPGKASVQALNAFERRSGDDTLTGRLTRQLQDRLIEVGDWRRFLGVSQSRLAGKRACEHLIARQALGKISGFDAAVRAQWVSTKRRGPLCRKTLAAIQESHTPPVAAIWERIYALMKAGKTREVKPLMSYLSSADRRRVDEWIAAQRAPEPFLRSGALRRDNPYNRRVLVDLVTRWSREAPADALAFWLEAYPAYRFYADRYYDTHRELVMRGAYRRLPEAQQWLHTLEARSDDLELMEWRVRTALLASDWPAVLETLAALPPPEQQEDHWLYWEARAQEALGRNAAAERIYQRLASLATYHGFLAADRLGQAYRIEDEPIPATEAQLDELAARPGLLRAREYHAVGLTAEARREWKAVMPDLDLPAQGRAAVLAGRWGLTDRAIFTAYAAGRESALRLRFPLRYRSEVAQAAEAYRIEPAWIFGVMRRESAFIADIGSRAGAVGLMQLMPNTAKFVARGQGLSNWSGDLTDPAQNIDFGAWYLRHVMDQFDDHVPMTIAGYNAGPHRSRTWQQPTRTPADIWIDTIPFTETRRYVRAVLAYTALYEWQLTGEAWRLSDKLKPVPAGAEET